MSIIRSISFHELPLNVNHQEAFLRNEWLVTNGLGGYSSCSISGITTRKYHGLLVAALPRPFGRTIMLNHLSEELIFPDGQSFLLGCEERTNGELSLEGMGHLKEFRLEEGLPVWIFEINGIILEKRILLIHLQNTVHISYKILSENTAKLILKLQPSLHFRPHESPVNLLNQDSYIVTAIDHHYEISNGLLPPLKLYLQGQKGTFTLENQRISNIFFRIESGRGYESVGDLWSPGYFKADLSSNDGATLIASTEPWETVHALTPSAALEAEKERRNRLLYRAPKEAQAGIARELVLAADQFIITPESRIEEEARAHAAGDEVRTVIAGYHWFTDWGRDTMISLEGLTLCTGREHEARWILRTFAHYVKNGLIPNMFPEGKNEGLYHTADATLWFFHALNRYVEVTGDRETLQLILPKLQLIVKHHLEGTRFGIGVDPADGLLKQGEEGYQLTWMDAKVGDWVVTPRRGKAVEINALWYNALRLLQHWITEEQGAKAARPLKEEAEKVYQSFNKRFWYDEGNYLYDVIDGAEKEDAACRPNQLLAISLKYPVLDPKKWKAVVDISHKQLLTPFGLRSLSPLHPDYKSRYDGDLRSRDAAYHQGTVWTWLIGPFIDAWLKLYPNKIKEARQFLNEFEKHLAESGIGTISEIFDAVEPYTSRGCIAQAWSVAEVLRCWLKTSRLEKEPQSASSTVESECLKGNKRKKPKLI